MRDKINVTKPNGESIVAELVTSFKKKDSGERYLIYTLNEIDANGLMKVYIGKVSGEVEPFTLQKIEDEAEWTDIKDIVRNVISGGNENG